MRLMSNDGCMHFYHSWEPCHDMTFEQSSALSLEGPQPVTAWPDVVHSKAVAYGVCYLGYVMQRRT